MPVEEVMPPDEEAPLLSTTSRLYHSFSRQHLANHLLQCARVRKLGSAPSEPDPSSVSFIAQILITLPRTVLGFQVVWTVLVTLIAYALAPKGISSFSDDFWTSHINVSSSVAYAVGWALFILLGFFVREASNRFWKAQLNWTHMDAQLRGIVRDLRQSFPPGSWHPGDLDRIVAHLVAFPIALKMHLRGEREAQQLERILCKEDISDVISAKIMPFQCTRVIRTYLSAAQDDAPVSFKSAAMQKSPAGRATHHILMNNVDAIDSHASILITISQFTPSAGYINHLHIFLYIWMFFLPLTIVQTSGWFTVVWTVLISYSISMLYYIAMALNDPFGYDIHDIKLNEISCGTALRIFNTFFSQKSSYVSLIDAKHDTPAWLEQPAPASYLSKSNKIDSTRDQSFISSSWTGYVVGNVTLTLFTLLMWTTVVVLWAWYKSKNIENGNSRWWSIYIPVKSSTDAYVSLGLSLVLGFWLNDSYQRYSRGLELWLCKVKPAIEEIAFRFAIVCEPGTWHQRDRERLFSHIAALPFAAKLMLRDSRDTSELHALLSSKDIAAFNEAEDLFEHAMDVIFAYCNSLDSVNKEYCNLSQPPARKTGRSIAYALKNIETAVQECVAIHRYPASPSLTAHLHVFSYLWLFLLPLITVEFNGFLVFFYVIPVGYSVVNLLEIGKNISEPFGFDPDDIPLQTFCEEMKQSLHDIYKASASGSAGYIYESGYSRIMFEPKEMKKSISSTLVRRNIKEGPSIWKWLQKKRKERAPSLISALARLLSKIPSLKAKDMIMVISWNMLAVVSSYITSILWDNEKRNACHAWCSPIDVDLRVLKNAGFSLFLILAFRASAAIWRYEKGVRLLFELKMQLRSLALEVSQTIMDGEFHDNDKERIVAHIAQIPLTFRDCLLGGDFRKRVNDVHGLLSKDDKRALENSQEPLSYLLQSIESYIILQDMEHPAICNKKGRYRFDGKMVTLLLNRVLKIRELLHQAFAVKKYPVVKSYTRHQYLFTVIWLMLLPFAMTPKTGGFTILLAPIISYGVLALEEVAKKLVDPYGTDDIDIPVDKICLETAEFVIDGVVSAEWDCKRYLEDSFPDSNAYLGVKLRHQTVRKRYILPHLENVLHSDVEDCDMQFFDRLEAPKAKPNLYSHITYSIPWKALLLVTCYTGFTVFVSFMFRNPSKNAKWWFSAISIARPVGSYVSFPDAAFDRYKEAGNIWVHTLHSSCHSLAVQFLTLFESGTIHEGDHERIIAHIAALPLVLKSEVRKSRDVRQVKGLISQEDIARVHCATSMSRHCLEVLKAYQLAAATRPEYSKKTITFSPRFIAIQKEMELLEEAVQHSEFLSTIPIAPSFSSLLNALLGIWFFILPFALAEISGWFTIFLVPIIAFGVLGMYSIAEEIQDPFGLEVNDLDLDEFAHNIVSDVLHIARYYRSRKHGLITPSKSSPYWKTKNIENLLDGVSGLKHMSDTARLARSALTPWALIGMLAWTVVSTIFAWYISKIYPFERYFNDSCAPWFCSRVAIDSSVEEYIGYALFLLLGLRLYDSHLRYVSATQIWQQGIFCKLLVLSNRLFESYQDNVWHSGDLQRLAAHLAGFAIAVMSKLRGEDYEAEFQHVLGEEDTRKVLLSPERASYCIDVVENYLAQGERISSSKDMVYPAGDLELEHIWTDLHSLNEYSFECDKMVRVPMPYGYLQHLNIILVIWFILLPLALVESSGWLTVFWIPFILYGVLGIEKWAAELSNPFGFDISDVPLESFVEKCVGAVRCNFHLYGNGVRDVVETNRIGFPL